MQVTLTQEDLNRSLQNLSRFVASRAQLPILSNLLLETGENYLQLSATNLELGFQQKVPATIQSSGKITVPATELTEFVNYLSPGKINLNLTENNLLEITNSKQSATLTTQLADDFPPLQIGPNLHTLVLPWPELSSSLDQILFAAASDDSRPVLTGLLLKFDNTRLTIAATDGFRLSLLTKELPKAISTNIETFLVPAKTFSELTKLAKNEKEIKLSFDTESSQLAFVINDNSILFSRLLQGDYPDYQRIIPQSNTTTLTLDRDESLQAIKSASIFARQSANVVRFKIGTSSLNLSANAPQLGKNQTEVEAKIEGKPLEIAFNYKFLLDFLNSCPSHTYSISLNQPLSPALFKDPNTPDFIHIIMPLRLQD